MMRWIVGMLILPALVLAWGVAAPAQETGKEIKMRTVEYGFSPSAITVKVGQRVEIELTNRGTMVHEFVSPLFKAARAIEIEAMGVTVEADEIEDVELAPGKTVTIGFTPTKAATFQFWCGQKTKGKLHRDLGMKGTIRVAR